MPVDWKRLQAALQQSREGHNLQALAIYSSLMQDAETDSDRVAIVLGEASCYSQLGNVEKSTVNPSRRRREAVGASTRARTVGNDNQVASLWPLLH